MGEAPERRCRAGEAPECRTGEAPECRTGSAGRRRRAEAVEERRTGRHKRRGPPSTRRQRRGTQMKHLLPENRS